MITSYDLMSKFKKILAKTPRVKTLIYMEDQLKQLENNGYKDGVDIVTFSEVLKKGSESKIGKNSVFINKMKFKFLTYFLI